MFETHGIVGTKIYDIKCMHKFAIQEILSAKIYDTNFKYTSLRHRKLQVEKYTT
jgi:hypothetical protein